ncbi:RNA-binding protein Csx1 [Lentinula edodes]|nr:RNA-binding protein Csx1 [Lentinula edodes]
MSRDSVEYNHPPGFGYLRSGAEGMESQRSTVLPVDRRGSASFSIYEGFEVPNRHNPGGSATLTGLNVTNSPHPAITRSTLFWGNLEPWMDEEYAKQVCGLMGWDPISLKIPPSDPDTTTGQIANNPGYCFLTFPSQTHAASVLAGLSGSPPITMPNSTKPFSMGWASMVPSTTSTTVPTTFGPPATSLAPQPYPKEYSIFVGDLAPETSNSDLVAVFRNPVLGLRNDREPKFIRPFLSCKSAKIMLDPVTGVSRGYGFVRFTDESDQQRALIEMHGLYCLSRPMRISPATAKFKPAPTMVPQDLAQFQQFVNSNTLPANIADSVTIAVSLPQKTVSYPIGSSTQPMSPINATPSATSSHSASSLATTASTSSLGAISTDTGSSASIATTAGGSENGTVPTKLYDSNPAKSALSSSITAPFAQEVPRLPMDYNPAMGSTIAERFLINEESWKHHTQARAILGNLIGPNGEQLTSTDPYNTTVFVGGLSPLIQEETLRTFFAPFGDIHYVKVPVGKHCGFVQFVRKADAERAIEKMQGFPIGGSRIRLSWGRSQYKAAQAAAQAAQAAAMQSQSGPQTLHNMTMPMPSSLQSDNTSVSAVSTAHLTQEQAIQLLQKLSQQTYTEQPFSFSSSPTSSSMNGVSVGAYANPIARGAQPRSSQHLQFPRDAVAGAVPFSPFSPDPNAPHVYQKNVFSDAQGREPYGFPPLDEPIDTGASSATRYTSSSARPPSVSRYTSFQGLMPRSGSGSTSTSPTNRTNIPVPISRPLSGQPTSTSGVDPFEMHDLNGTLASLDLGEASLSSVMDSRPWGVKSPAGSSDSSASVQFQMTRDDVTSS